MKDLQKMGGIAALYIAAFGSRFNPKVSSPPSEIPAKYFIKLSGISWSGGTSISPLVSDGPETSRTWPMVS